MDRRTKPVRTHPLVAEALEAGRPVVGLETALLTHGLPKEPLAVPECLADEALLRDHLAAPLAWDPAMAANLQVARLMVRAVQDAGAIPAAIGLIAGELVIGLDDDELAHLAVHEDVAKASVRDLAPLAVAEASAGTTVAASVRACTLADPSPIRVFATGGIGGVHRGWQTRPDISADLIALADHPVAVVASGAKVILDLVATTEALDTLGVPVIGCGAELMPSFTAGLDQALPLDHHLDDPESLARLCHLHWTVFQATSGVLIARPCPAGLNADSDALDRLVNTGLAEAAALGIDGGAVTPFLLGSIGRSPESNALSANIALLLANAACAARVAGALSNL